MPDYIDPFGEPEEKPRVTYCLVPPDLAPKLYESLKRYYAKDPNIEVIVDRRKGERRSGEERRKKNVGPPAGVEDRRRIRNDDGRRVGERRAKLIPVQPPDHVPRKARRYLAHPSDEELAAEAQFGLEAEKKRRWQDDWDDEDWDDLDEELEDEEEKPVAQEESEAKQESKTEEPPRS